QASRLVADPKVAQAVTRVVPGEPGAAARAHVLHAQPVDQERAELVRALRQPPRPRSEEHTSELQSLRHLVCRLLLEKKKRIASPASTTSSNGDRPHSFTPWTIMISCRRTASPPPSMGTRTQAGTPCSPPYSACGRITRPGTAPTNTGTPPPPRAAATMPTWSVPRTRSDPAWPAPLVATPPRWVVFEPGRRKPCYTHLIIGWARRFTPFPYTTLFR